MSINDFIDFMQQIHDLFRRVLLSLLVINKYRQLALALPFLPLHLQVIEITFIVFPLLNLLLGRPVRFLHVQDSLPTIHGHRLHLLRVLLLHHNIPNHNPPHLANQRHGHHRPITLEAIHQYHLPGHHCPQSNHHRLYFQSLSDLLTMALYYVSSSFYYDHGL